MIEAKSRLRKLGTTILVSALLAGTIAACGASDEDAGNATEPPAGNATEPPDTDIADVKFTGSLEAGLPNCYTEPEAQDLTIGFASPIQASEPVKVEGKAMELETKRLGGDFVVIDAQADPDKQVTAVEQLIARRVDGIVVFPVDPQALSPVVQKAKAADIPVIGIDVAIDSTDPGPGYDSQVWQGRDRMTYLQAKAAADLLEPGSEVVQTGFALPVPTIEQAVERAGYWATKFGLKPVGRANNQTDDIVGGEKAMAELLAQHPDAKGLISYNDNTAIGASAALRSQGMDDYVLIGNNGDTAGYGAVESGKIDATVQIPAPEMGKCAVWGIYDAVQGAKLPKTVLGGKPQLITAENVDEVPTWSQTLEERYGSTGSAGD